MSGLVRLAITDENRKNQLDIGSNQIQLSHSDVCDLMYVFRNLIDYIENQDKVVEELDPEVYSDRVLADPELRRKTFCLVDS